MSENMHQNFARQSKGTTRNPVKTEHLKFFEIGQQRLNEKDYQGAIEAFTQTIKLKPRFHKAHQSRGIAFEKLGKSKEAEKDLIKSALLQRSETLLVTRKKKDAELKAGEFDQALEDAKYLIMGKFDKKLIKLLVEGSRFYNSNKFEEAVDLFSKVIDIAPWCAEAFYLRGKSYKQLNVLEEAREDLIRAKELTPSAKVFFELGGCDFMEGNFADAMRMMNETIKLDKTNKDAHFNRAQILYVSGKAQNLNSLNSEYATHYFEESLNECELAKDVLGVKHELIVLKAKNLLELGKHTIALEELNKSLTSKETPSALFLRALIHNQMGNNQDALKDLNRIIEGGHLDSVIRLSEFYELMYDCYLGIGDVDSAISAKEKSADSRLKEGAKDNLLLAQDFVTKGKMEEALPYISKSLELFDQNSYANAMKGEILVTLKRYQESIPCFNRAIELEKNPDYFYKKANAFMLSGNYEDAEKTIEEGLKLDKRLDRRYLLLLALKTQIFIDQEKFEDALKVFQKLIRLDPGEPSYYINRSEIYHGQGRFNLSLREINQAIRIDRKDANNYNHKGNIFFQMNQYERAIIEYEKGIKLAKEEPTLQSTLIMNKASCLRYLGKYGEAMLFFDEAIKLDPKNATAFRLRGDLLKKLGQEEKGDQDHFTAEQLEEAEDESDDESVVS